MPIRPPFGELDLCDQFRCEPDAVFHFFLGQGPFASVSSPVDLQTGKSRFLIL
jgi:hypothetical protein